MMDAIAARVADGETVEFRPTGNSMVPLIQSRQNVRVEPVDATKVEVGDIVLVRVANTKSRTPSCRTGVDPCRATRASRVQSSSCSVTSVQESRHGDRAHLHSVVRGRLWRCRSK
jgi:hypothetical protein